ncbi:Acetyltransferase YpeA [Botrimarina colliarenosi]|uniref:Acetyltransferase YpeA n=1 Tax=Botrimarina colliarenosi TaxID=2528001 RepID=A0A5C6AFG4_9BACT|nr:GNAT family N-acetyltransferase [Botrimarina colliarenosi]TWT97925.1 Acetyltransferase YpeA [Botrimarina colliarenosi]
MPNAMLIRRADLSSTADATAFVAMLDAYSRDPMGDGQPLANDVRERLVPALREHPTTLIWLAFDGDRPVGLLTAFVGFSTFKAKPLINVHDVAVLPETRGRGVGRALLSAVEEHARATGCCKLTLEVLENNTRAKGLYEAVGYQQATYAPEAGGALFYAKPLL